MNIQRATTKQLEEVAILFNEYRMFYNQPSDLAGARTYLKDRMSGNDSVIFLCFEGEEAIGFTQLYPTFSSIGMKRAWILNDLFVAKDARRKGVGDALLQAARAHALETGASSLSLSTAPDNLEAQRLYERNGYRQDETFLHYELSL
ncbi:GNAT family N-acetyltransferase [Rossellomorea marisflavi]|jgi:ribosomal protein S18 acetylase RimI-like enzyme|uniref:GNAT family N-acetyltransferase n=1 Tax=Rossellomorea marisflavi TaxID=189381 RepID=UPI00203F8A98|nr:GNAT family N-acetyltransferase [Rossellomorea marisflavi]MCM2603357.1 GNAT family N-acetyltransferase [Rossellomorea marisflavi]